MSVIANIPTLLYLLIAYNILIFLPEFSMSAPLFEWHLISGAVFQASSSDLLIAFGVLALYIELFKATRTSTSSIIEHGLSMLLFIVFLVEFIVIKGAGTSTFLILTLLQLLDVVAGFTITISTARRDFGMGGH
jgi:hypothetical protein